jgi:hypothetical protein
MKNVLIGLMLLLFCGVSYAGYNSFGGLGDQTIT